jgi:hypothetical protein
LTKPPEVTLQGRNPGGSVVAIAVGGTTAGDPPARAPDQPGPERVVVLVNRLNVYLSRLSPALLRIDPVAPPLRDYIYRTKRAARPGASAVGGC